MSRAHAFVWVPIYDRRSTVPNMASARGDSPSSSIDAELEKNLRENIRLTEEIQNMIESESGSNDILKQLEILAALRDAHEPEPISTSRAASVGKPRDRTKRKHTDSLDDRESIAAESPSGGGPSPKVMISTKERLMAKSGGSRAGSVPIGRESSVKAEDAAENSELAKGKLRRSSRAPTQP
jgi:SAGA-associated factor 29